MPVEAEHRVIWAMVNGPIPKGMHIHHKDGELRRVKATMNLESKLKTDLVSDCRKLGAYARRLEDKYAIGLLDLTIKFPGHPHLLAEGKLVEHQSFAPTLRQFEEGRRYVAAGGLCALIAWDKKTKAMFIHDWAESALKKDCFPPGGGYKPYAETLRDWLEWRATK